MTMKFIHTLSMVLTVVLFFVLIGIFGGMDCEQIPLACGFLSAIVVVLIGCFTAFVAQLTEDNE